MSSEAVVGSYIEPGPVDAPRPAAPWSAGLVDRSANTRSAAAACPTSISPRFPGRECAPGIRSLLSELLVASGRHDEAAFARLYQLTSPWIYYLLRRRTNSTAHAEDAMVLVYTAIWQRAATFVPPNQSALAWVTTLAYDVVVS
jgi:hypothetical protein